MAASKVDLPAAAVQWLELKVGKTVVDHKRTLEEVSVLLTVICVCVSCRAASLSVSCFYDEIKGNQDLETCSHADSLFLTVVCVFLTTVVFVSLFLTNEHWRR